MCKHRSGPSGRSRYKNKNLGCLQPTSDWKPRVHWIVMSKVHPTALTISAGLTLRGASMAIFIRFWKKRSWPLLTDIFNFLGGGCLGFFTGVLFFSPHIPNYLIAWSCKSSIVLENGERKWPKIGNVILAKFDCFNIICVDCHFQNAGLSKE